jgi:hypothetical protein
VNVFRCCRSSFVIQQEGWSRSSSCLVLPASQSNPLSAPPSALVPVCCALALAHPSASPLDVRAEANQAHFASSPTAALLASMDDNWRLDDGPIWPSPLPSDLRPASMQQPPRDAPPGTSSRKPRVTMEPQRSDRRKRASSAPKTPRRSSAGCVPSILGRSWSHPQRRLARSLTKAARL